MKTLTVISFFIFFSSVLSAQTSLTFEKNGLISGDSFTFREIQFPDPGKAGRNQVWDYSNIKYTGKSPVGTLQNAPAQKISGVGTYNLLLSDNGYDYFMNSSPNKLEELGYINNDLKITLSYSDPVIKMKYPFSYGEQFSDHFIGAAMVNETSRIDFFGDCTVSADAYGTLILPDRVIDNALRVTATKKGLQINMCGTADVNIVKYSWFVSGYRYPVLTASIIENSNNGGAPVITKSAFTNTLQLPEQNATLKSATIANQSVAQDVIVTISPNPFNDQLTFNYSLPEQRSVSIELYDTSGKQSGWLVKSENQSEGLHTGELKATTFGLTPGIYFLRFAFDQQVVIRKIVKL